MSWAMEKAYVEKRARELGSEMDEAIRTRDKEQFRRAFQTAMQYLRRKELGEYLRRFVEGGRR